MIVANHHNQLGLVLDYDYEQAYTPLHADPDKPFPNLAPNWYAGTTPNLGLVYVDNNPLGFISWGSTTGKLAAFLGLAAGIGGGVYLWKRRGRGRRSRK